MIDAVTQSWIRNKSDERAAANGCRFDVARGEHAVNWIQDYCCLYEGEWAGQRIKLLPWQRDVVMRVFGWVRHSNDWGREIRRFRRGGLWVPKKNGKSPLLAAIGLYLLCGDGEQGQKVFTSAKDGKQAMIAHTHAQEMVRRSPELMSECRINQMTGRITHEPSRSFYSIVAGDNINSQEGLNGSVLVDETHVVNAKLMKVLRGAGISRAEPLQLEFSTAGNNPDGYGKSAFDYGLRASQSGDDEQYFFQAFYAPQDVSDEELDKNLVEIGKAANPSWGHTIKEGEFVAEYNAAKKSIADIADFKMYRLNVWQRSSNPWLRGSDWDKNKRDYSEQDLKGCVCYGGMDLAQKQDMAALGLVFPWEDESYRTLCYFWMTEAAANKNSHLVSFLQWAHDGHLTIVPDDMMDYAAIRAAIREKDSLFDMRELAYDETYAWDSIQMLTTDAMEQHSINATPIVFPQKIMTFASPTAEFEQLLIGGKFHHNDNPVLNWQAGHVAVMRDTNNNRRPVKPDGNKDSIKKIDGIVALIMALARARLNAGVAQWDGRVSAV